MLRLSGAASRICGNFWARSATCFRDLGSVMPSVSKSAISTLSTITTYALSPASQAKALWMELELLRLTPLASFVSPAPSRRVRDLVGRVTSRRFTPP